MHDTMLPTLCFFLAWVICVERALVWTYGRRLSVCVCDYNSLLYFLFPSLCCSIGMPCESLFSSRGKTYHCSLSWCHCCSKTGRGWDFVLKKIMRECGTIRKKRSLSNANALMVWKAMICAALWIKRLFLKCLGVGGREEERVCVKMEQLLQITFTNRPEGNSFFYYSFSNCYWTKIRPSTQGLAKPGNQLCCVFVF